MVSKLFAWLVVMVALVSTGCSPPVITPESVASQISRHEALISRGAESIARWRMQAHDQGDEDFSSKILGIRLAASAIYDLTQDDGSSTVGLEVLAAQAVAKCNLTEKQSQAALLVLGEAMLFAEAIINQQFQETDEESVLHITRVLARAVASGVLKATLDYGVSQ